MADKNIIVGGDFERAIEQSLGELLLLLLDMHGDNVLQIDAVTGKTLTANSLLKQAVCLAEWMRARNIGVGDFTSIISENRLEFCVVPVATFFLAATFAPLNPVYTPGELKHVLNLSKPKIIFTSPKYEDKIIKILPDYPYIKHVVVFGPGRLNMTSFDDIIKGFETRENVFQTPEVNPEETVATILCSSGTTGLPKGVMCTQANITSFMDIMRSFLIDYIEDEDPNDTIMGLVPFFHSFGFMVMFLNLLRGKRTVVISKFNPKVFLDAIVKYNVTRLNVPPPVILFLLKHPLVKQYNIQKLKEIRSGAAPLGKETEKQIKERFDVDHVSQAYGMTETTLGVLVSPPKKSKLGSVGKLVPGMMCKIVDENGKILGPYQEGELCFKGPLIMKGYINDPVSTADTIDKDGWLHTGDIGYYDNEQYFFIVDRLKELIKYKAFQVAPAELEALLLTHESVLDAAVVGLPNEEAGELPYAFVVLKPGHNTTTQQLQDFVKERVSPQKWLRGGVEFINEIPRNQTGKILRRVLRERAKVKSKL